MSHLDPNVPHFEESSPRAAYLHVPFCRRRCFYCDFPVSVVGDRRHGGNSSTIEDYVDALCREIGMFASHDVPLETLFFGGGTPSLLTATQLDRLIDTVGERLGIATGAEISIEMDPGTFDLAKLQGYRAAGVNRISLGVQAFDDDLLQKCGRSHSVAEIYTAVELLRQAQVANFSLDLISGLPHQTLDSWQGSLEAAIALSPHHLSVYDLIVEPKTVFDRYYQPGSTPLPTDETAAQMYQLAQETLTAAGYEHYEISNYARPGYACRHNLTYWKNLPYYGFGMGATSYLNTQRLTRPRKLREYYGWLAESVAAGSPVGGAPTPDDEQLLEALMVGFRLAEGVSLPAIDRQFSRTCGSETIARIWQCLTPYVRARWVVATDARGNVLSADAAEGKVDRLRLSDPEGFLVSNTILAALFESLG
ncbi:MAG: radical SAM family heme chaperone HemW [Cyanobacteriota bacterium]|nr:radical SAM family heme chaperone HemW [Cyanobacteriota bacterium]